MSKAAAISAAQYGNTISKLKSNYNTGPNSSYLGALVMTAMAAPLSEVITTKHIQKKKEKIYMYKLAPLWKRLAAELYTDLHLFLFRILFTIACVRYFEFNFHNLIAPLTQMHSYYDKLFCFLLERGLGENLDGFDYEKYLQRMTELLPEFKSDPQAWLWLLTVHFWTIFTHFAMIDSFFQTIICISEFVSMRRLDPDSRRPGGRNLGKKCLGLKVIQVDMASIRETPVSGVILCRGVKTMSLWNAFVRVFVKRISALIFIPACISCPFYQHNLAFYDILASTIVVEEDSEVCLNGNADEESEFD